jgi:MFS transporter, UMF1 family
MAAGSSDAVPSGPPTELSRYCWVLFEWGRNPYVLIITIYVYATYFAREIVGDPVRGQALWADIQAYAGLAVAVSAPFLGAIADAGGRRKPWIAAFSLLLIAATASLWFGAPMGAGLGITGIAMVIALGHIAYDGSFVFHNAMLPSLVPAASIGRWSGAGYGLGNLAGILLLVFILVFIYLPAEPLFGLSRAEHEHERIAGPIIALWFAVFSLPFFLFVPDGTKKRVAPRKAIAEGFSSALRTIRTLPRYHNTARFLLARMIYSDGLNVMLAFGGVYAAGIFGWGEIEIAVYGIMLSLFAAAGGFLGGFLGDRIGVKRALLISLGGIFLAALLSLGFSPERLFFVFPYRRGEAVLDLPYFRTAPELLYIGCIMTAAICLVATFANSRTMLAKLAPRERLTEFFGLFALSGGVTAFAAPMAVALATRLSGSQQGGMAAILAFIAVGFLLLLTVREGRDEENSINAGNAARP